MPDVVCRQSQENKCAYSEQRFLQNCSASISCHVAQLHLSLITLDTDIRPFYRLNFDLAFHNYTLTGHNAAKFTKSKRVLCETAGPELGECNANKCQPLRKFKADFLSSLLADTFHRILLRDGRRVVPLSLDCINATSDDKSLGAFSIVRVPFHLYH